MLRATGGATGKRPRGPSVFLEEVRDGCLAGRRARSTRWAGAGRRDNPLTAELARGPSGRPTRSARAAGGPTPGAALVARRRATPASRRWPTGRRGRPRARPDERPARAVVELGRATSTLLLAERARRRGTTAADVALPGAPVGHRSWSSCAATRPRWPARLRRPLPRRPAPARPPRHRLPRLAGAALRRRPAARRRRAARRGRRGRRRRRAARRAAGGVPGARVGRARRRSRWRCRSRRSVGGVVVRGRMDAVFADPDGGFDGGRLEDRRAARPGRGAARAAVQLAAYRLAWAALAGVPARRGCGRRSTTSART